MVINNDNFSLSDKHYTDIHIEVTDFSHKNVDDFQLELDLMGSVHVYFT